MKVSIIGASGYTGVELLRILHNHPNVEILFLSSQTKEDISIDKIYPHLLKVYENKFVSQQKLLDAAEQTDVIFTALPHGHSLAIGKLLQATKTKLIDLGADYRFCDESIYEKWYKLEHTHKNSGAVFGLSELNYEAIKNAKILANPGCYPTASILSLYPLIKADLIDVDTIIIDAASGTTGAGRQLRLSSHFSEVFENFTAYGVTNHRHTPEIEMFLASAFSKNITITFTPHLVPMARGILTTAYAKIKNGVTLQNLNDAYKIYADKYFIRLIGQNSPATKNTRGSNFVDIGWFLDERTNRVVALAALDNLVKGASGQAVQNMNIMFNFPQETGLNFSPVYP
ncbi:MAG: N-acetyl-gamma-glutamyl-phosphate reductase [Elusimicrobiota bacterium]|jgi:N-acetyl-gamma-glutamyl-phosphate reductase|nr:N-acetyl-gamma-glutamyl-phosphate reductase [Elusimicrobiota bacterium]